VLLGENYFAKRTALQAREIIQRRQQFLDEKILGISSQIEGFQARISLQSEVSAKQEEQIVDIREEYVSDEEEEIKSLQDVKLDNTKEKRAEG